jgi:hypothetical protein
MYRELDGTQRCPRCSSSEYNDGEEFCPVCYGTNWFNEQTGLGGVKKATRAWCVFSDHIVSEQYGQFGTLDPDQRQVQCEAFPMLIEHDYIVRVRQWGPGHTVVKIGGFFEVTAVTRNSLRTGSQYGQTWQDVIGQAATVNWIPPNTKGITAYPVEGLSFLPHSSSPLPLPKENNLNMLTYTQSIPSTLWTIPHNLGHDPSVTIVIGGQLVSGDVTYPNPNLVTIAFATPQAGIAQLV